MSTITTSPLDVAVVAPRRERPTPLRSAFVTLTRRRAALSARTPREIVVPLLTPILFADVIAPALAQAMPATSGIDYVSFVAVGTIGLLVPLSCVLGGIGMIVDRDSGAQRDLLAAPVPRSLMVVGNLAVAIGVSSLQVAALIVAARVRGAGFTFDAAAVAWSVAAVIGIAIAMHSVAEILAARIERQEEYVGAAPPIALVPWFFAGSFFPISAMPAGLTAFAKLLPLTHALAVLRYALVDHTGQGLHDIWGMDNTTVMAALSLGVVALFATGMFALATRVFSRSAIG